MFYFQPFSIFIQYFKNNHKIKKEKKKRRKKRTGKNN